LNEAAKGALTGAAFGSLHFMEAGAAKWAAHGAVGGVSSMMNGGKFWRGFISQAFSEASGDVLPNLNSEKTIGGAIAEGTKRIMIGGTVSYLSGGKFGNGAATAAMGYLFNNCGNGECTPGSDSSIIGMQGNTAGYTGTINDGDRAVLIANAGLAAAAAGGAAISSALGIEGVSAITSVPRALQAADFGLSAARLAEVRGTMDLPRFHGQFRGS
jgi:hypothetical protein